MKRYIVLTIIGSLFITLACENNKGTKQNSEPLDLEVANSIKLNEGKKWMANEETIEGIQNMKQIVGSSSNILSHDSVKKSLQNEINTIFLKCNMKGEAHDQLHNYLLPLKAKVNELSDDDQLKIDEIEIYLNDFSEYFQ